MACTVKGVQYLTQKYQFSIKKKFGQNFIIDENIIKQMIEKSGLCEEDIVLEIGPGACALTVYLASLCKEVVCYEIDSSLKPLIDEALAPFSNVTVFYSDFLKADVLKELGEKSNVSLIANLPYYITTPIIMKVILDSLPISKMIVMVQKEVGDRFRAIPGTKDYGSLSVLLQYYFSISKVMDVSRHVFLPEPRVDSIVICLKRKKDLPYLKDAEFFKKFIQDCFRQKRKTLRNNLKEYPLPVIEKVLMAYGMDLSVRAEQLTVAQFIEIANAL